MNKRISGTLRDHLWDVICLSMKKNAPVAVSFVVFYHLSMYNIWQSYWTCEAFKKRFYGIC